MIWLLAHRCHFTERPEKAFSSTLKGGFVEIGGDCHADSLMDFAIACWGFRFGSLEQGSGSVQSNSSKSAFTRPPAQRLGYQPIHAGLPKTHEIPLAIIEAAAAPAS